MNAPANLPLAWNGGRNISEEKRGFVDVCGVFQTHGFHSDFASQQWFSPCGKQCYAMVQRRCAWQSRHTENCEKGGIIALHSVQKERGSPIVFLRVTRLLPARSLLIRPS